MRIGKVQTFSECQKWALDWWNSRKDNFAKHSTNASLSISNLEPMDWPTRMLILADAYGWAKLVEPEIRECEMQAIAILTGTKDDNGKFIATAKAESMCFEIHALVKALKQLAETADRKLSTLQSLNRQR